MNKTVQKTHWLRTTLIVLIVCGLVGTVMAGVIFTSNKAATNVSSTLQMDFANAASGLAPNGNRFDVQDITSDNVLQSALEAASLSDVYTPEQIRSSLQVRGVYPEDLEEQFTKSVSILNNTDNSSQMLTLSDYHPTTFSVKLSNEFDTSISQAQLTSLLKNILTAYKTYFNASGANKLETGMTVFTVSDYDYIQRLKIIRMKLENLTKYATELSEKDSSFRLNGKGFDDIVVRISNLMTGDLSRLEGQVTVGALSKDNNRLLTQYEYAVQTLTEELKSQTENLEKTDKLVDSYKKNATIYIYVSTSGALNKIAGNSSITYDALVEERNETAEHIAELKVKIEDYQQKIEDIKNGTAAVEEKAPETEATAEETSGEKKETPSTAHKQPDAAVLQKLEADIDLLISRTQEIITDFDAMIQAQNEEHINDQMISTTAIRYYTPKLLSGAFAKLVIKTAGPFCTLGLMVCLMLIFFIRRKEEKAKG